MACFCSTFCTPFTEQYILKINLRVRIHSKYNKKFKTDLVSIVLINCVYKPNISDFINGSGIFPTCSLKYEVIYKISNT